MVSCEVQDVKCHISMYRALGHQSLKSIILLLVCSVITQGWAAEIAPPLTGNYHQTQVVGYLRNPWAAVENPLGGWLITERQGVIVEYTNTGFREEIPLQIDDLYVAGQGGLLDIVLADDFTETRRIYLSYALGTDDENYLAMGTTTLDSDKPVVETLFKTTTPKDTPVHFGGRLLELSDGTWLLTSGDGFDYREQAQIKSSFLGKVIRFRLDGSAPGDNPFYEGNGAPQDYIFSLGHRNPQGLAYDTESGLLWLHEHGPAGGDEINLLVAGINYGWPIATQGKDYSGAQISPFTEYPGMANPVLNWTPSIAPSSMVVYHNDVFPQLDNHLLITSLKNKALYAVALDQNPMSAVQIFATINERLRDVIIGRDGSIFVLTDGERGRLMRFSPLRPENVPEHSLR